MENPIRQLVTLEDCVLWHETENAIKISTDLDDARVWLPKAAIKYRVSGVNERFVDIDLPESLAIEKGLV